MLLLLLNHVVIVVIVVNLCCLRALWKIDVYLISTLVNKRLHYYYKSLYSTESVDYRVTEIIH